MSCSAAFVTVSEQPLANRILPVRIRSTTESWITSVYISKMGMPAFSPMAFSTAFAVSPTPDWMGRKGFGTSPRFSSAARKSATLRPMRAGVSVISLNPPVSSGASVCTTATIFFGSTLITGEPMRSEGRKRGRGLR